MITRRVLYRCTTTAVPIVRPAHSPSEGLALEDVAVAHSLGQGEQHFGFLVGLAGVAEVVPEDDGADVVVAQTFVDAGTI